MHRFDLLLFLWFNRRSDHEGKTIKCNSQITINNNSDAVIDDLIFSLNPGLRISKVASGGSELNFQREKHIVIIKPSGVFSQGDSLRVEIEYSGSINDNACYLDVNETKRNELKRLLSDDGVKDIVDNSVAKEEAQAKIGQFLKGEWV